MANTQNETRQVVWIQLFKEFLDILMNRVSMASAISTHGEFTVYLYVDFIINQSKTQQKKSQQGKTRELQNCRTTIQKKQVLKNYKSTSCLVEHL